MTYLEIAIFLSGNFPSGVSDDL